MWDEVHISSVLPPDRVYQTMITENKDIDTLKQLYRRIDTIVYHWHNSDGFYRFDLPFAPYTDYDSLRQSAAGGFSGFLPAPEGDAVFQ